MTRLLIGHRIEGNEREAEPVVVDAVGETVAFTLDDGQIIVLDWAELCEAVEGKRQAA